MVKKVIGKSMIISISFMLTLIMFFLISNNVKADSISNLPTSYDITDINNPNHIYFPEIGTQTYSNCCSFASTYYQFTYEANKYNQIATTNDNTYSPFWTFSLTNGGYDMGTNLSEAFDAIKTFGGITTSEYNSEVANNGSINDLTLYWESSNNCKKNALRTRVKDYYKIEKELDSDQHYITFSENSDRYNAFDDIKSLLSQDKVLTFQVNYNPDIYQSTEFGYIIYSNKYCEALQGHALTIVGYDDNVGFDVNGINGIEPGEKGAFKVANSWGENTHNDGYVWILYDAFNPISAIPNWTDNDRADLFFNSYSNLYYINVANSDMNFLGEVSIDTIYKYQLSINIAKTTNSLPQDSDWVEILPNWSLCNEDTPGNSVYDGNIYFDFGTLRQSSDTYYNYYNWFIKIDKIYEYQSGINSIDFKIIDNLGNTISSFYENQNNEDVLYNPNNFVLGKVYYTSVNLIMGDLNYNGTRTEADVSILQNYLSNNINLSNIQYYLADCWIDNVINLKDVLALRQMIS